VAALAWNATSGTPRMASIVVLPAGRVFCQSGLAKIWLKPPPEKVQATSAAPPKVGLEHLAPTPETLYGRDERVPHRHERLHAAERPLGRREALGDDLGEAVVNHVLLGRHHLDEALNAERLGSGRGDEQDVGLGGDRMGRLNIERDFECPGALVL